MTSLLRRLAAATTLAAALAVPSSAFALPDQADQPDPSNQVIGAPGPSDSDVFRVTSEIFRTMTSTVYSHKYSENTKTGVYAFDCVGSVSYFLKRAAPVAHRDMFTKLKIRPGYVPSPPMMLSYLSGKPSRAWRVIRNLRDIRPGDVIVMDAIVSPDDGTPGHAMIAASHALLLQNGSYALTVYDSTGTPHGAADSRRWDPRTTPLPPKTDSGAPDQQQTAPGRTAGTTPRIGSGLGFGNIQLWDRKASQLSPPSEQMSWTIGTRPVRTGIIVARALR